MPRRSARNAAITNLKQFTTPQRKRAEPKKPTEGEENPESEQENSEEGESFDESEDEEELGSSDGEFVVKTKKRKGRKR